MSEVLQTKAAEIHINTGVPREERRELAQRLGVNLADSYTLYLKTQGFHWNVAGPLFYSLHKLTESQYEDLAEAIDEIAERIRALGFPAPASYRQFIELTRVSEEHGVPTAQEMVRQLVEANEITARNLRQSIHEAEQVDDVKTADMLTDRLGQHEENIWMLRALLAD
ncbi:MAG: Dps family protein [Candidatus Competibacteraceae bacterium]|nr:Dps family protein [Candidatus Competibacteraceae bacterium]